MDEKERHRKKWKANRDRYLEKKREYERANRDKRALNFIKRTYNVSKEAAVELFVKRQQSCEVCYRKWIPGEKALSIDHDHKTGQIRGILCHKCNTALGNVGDSEEILQRLIQYLKDT